MKPIEPNEFLARVNVLIRRSAAVPKTETKAKIAKTIGVFSLRGGSGVSSVAVNLAVGLSQLWKAPTALVDLVITGGQSALFLNQPLKHTWADVVRFPLEEIDDYAVKSALLPHKSGISTLASPRRPEHGDQVTTDKVNKVLGIMKSMHEYLVLDLAHDFSEITLAGLDQADEILVMLQPEVISIRSAAMALETFRELGYAEDKVRLLLNCTFPNKGISLEDVQRYLKRKVNIMLPYLADKTIEAINTGIPPVYSNPEETLGVIFEDLALALSKDTHRKDYPENPTEALKRTTKRYMKRRKTK